MLRLREALQDALDFSRNRVAWSSAQRRPYTRGRLDLEALVPVVRGELPLAVQANRASDLLAAMRLAQEFKLKLILMGAAEGWRVADQLAAQKVPGRHQAADEHPVLRRTRRHPRECRRGCRRPARRSFSSSFDTHNARNLRQEAGNAVAYGLDRDAALRAVTLTPAEVWGIAARYGSLEPGKDADVVVWSGDPFELTTGRRARLHPGPRDVEGHAPAAAARALSNDPLTVRIAIARAQNRPTSRSAAIAANASSSRSNARWGIRAVSHRPASSPATMTGLRSRFNSSVPPWISPSARLNGNLERVHDQEKPGAGADEFHLGQRHGEAVDREHGSRGVGEHGRGTGDRARRSRRTASCAARGRTIRVSASARSAAQSSRG